MLFISLLIALVGVYLLQYFLYKKFAFHNVRYTVEAGRGEVFENDEIYIYEEITNDKWLPLPYVKVDTELPDGLVFCITEQDRKAGGFRETYPTVIHSLFVLRGHQCIRRRWKIRCRMRGTYTLGNVTLLTDDILGTHLQSKIIVPDPEETDIHGNTGRNVLVVLPRAISLEKEFTSSMYNSGDVLVSRSLISDPLYMAGVREYQNGDPINRINWLKTASQQKLMVNVEEYTKRYAFNIVVNMQSRDMEKQIPGPPSIRTAVELCITVAASILDSVAVDRIPVRVICNTPPEQFGEEYNAAVSESDEAGAKVFVSPMYQGRNNILTALRMLAQLDLTISMPVERLLDHIVQNPYAYTSGGNIIFVSSFLNERMIQFCYAMRRQGITVIFYITTTSSNAQIIPDDVEVHFKAYKD
ncbi:MAG: DUF58 domain-containing protein [Clostridia bacterium]|nr:DUF58 domain-containing protein [Clostridia bacterium]